MADTFYTLPDQVPPYKRYVVTDITQTGYAYNWLLLEAADIAVYVNDVLTTDYTLTGLGVVTGGTVILFAGLPLGTILVLVRTMPRTQNALLSTGGILPALTFQQAFNRAVMLVQDIHEVLQRIPQLARTVRDGLRNLAFPQPGSAGAGVLLGWNASGTALTLYANVITVQTISPAVGHVYGRAVYTLNASGFTGTGEMRVVGGQLANTKTLGVTAVVDTTFDTAQGLASLLIGDDVLADRWSRVPIARTAGTVTGEGNFGPSPEGQVDSAADIVVRSVDGLFGSTGTITLVVHFRRLSNS